MRLALVHLRHAKSGGTERYLDRLARHLCAAGHEVEVVCRSHAEAPHPRVRFRVLRPLGLGGTWRLWSFARAVERHVERERYDLVVGLGRTWTQDVLRLGGGCQRTYLELAHRSTLTARKRLLGGGAWKHALAVKIEERALGPGSRAHVIVNSHMVRRDVQRRYALDEGRLSVIHNGVDLERFHPRLRATRGAALRAELGLGPGDCVWLFLGSGYARKGLDLALEAFAERAPARAELRLVVAGFDSAQAAYEQRARALGLDSRVRFLGGRLDAEALYAACDAYLLPTRYDPFANSTLEALASGLPVVTSTTNGGAELIEPGVEGAVVELGQGVGALAAALETWSEPERREAGGRAARLRAEAHGEGSKFEAAEALFARLAEQRRGAS